MKIIAILAAIATLASSNGSAQFTDHSQLVAGPLTLEIHVSRTAHLFHVVDQIAAWSEFCHRQYVDWFERQERGLSAEDRELLRQHTAIRKQRGWGGGLEQTFYTDESYLFIGGFMHDERGWRFVVGFFSRSVTI